MIKILLKGIPSQKCLPDNANKNTGETGGRHKRLGKVSWSCGIWFNYLRLTQFSIHCVEN